MRSKGSNMIENQSAILRNFNLKKKVELTNLEPKRFAAMVEDHPSIVTPLREHHLEEELRAYSNVVAVTHKRLCSLFHHCF